MRIGKGIYAAGSSAVIEAEDEGQIEFMINDDSPGHFIVSLNLRQF